MAAYVNISLFKACVNKKGKFPLPIEGGHGQMEKKEAYNAIQHTM